jgi:Flp pilus assembly pilin Flp
MNYFKTVQIFKRWLIENRAATLIEYGLIASALGIAAFAALMSCGDELGNLLSAITAILLDAAADYGE